MSTPVFRAIQAAIRGRLSAEGAQRKHPDSIALNRGHRIELGYEQTRQIMRRDVRFPILIALLSLTVVISNRADDKPSADETATTPTQHNVIPILLRRCTVCHGAHRKEA